MRRTIVGWIAVLVLFLSACGPAVTSTETAPVVVSTTVPSSSGITVQNAWARSVTVGDAAAEASGHQGHGAQGSMMATGTAMDHSGHSSGVTSAVYMQIVNNGSTPDQLVRATTDIADAVELHNTIIQDNVARMQPMTGIDVPANGQVEFKTGSFHVMLIDVKQTLKPGDSVPLTLTFQNAGEQQVMAQVREP